MKTTAATGPSRACRMALIEQKKDEGLKSLDLADLQKQLDALEA